MKYVILCLSLLLSPLVLLAAQQDQLMYFQETKTDCLWMQFDMATGNKQILNKTRQCPQQLAWDVKKKVVYYSLDNAFYTFSLQDKKHNTLLAKFNLAEAVIDRFWVAKETGRLRVVVLVPVDESRLKTRTLKDGDTVYVIPYQGAEYTVPTFYPGIPYIGVVAEWTNDKWVNVFTFATTSDAGESLGIGPAYQYINIAATIKSAEFDSEHISLALDDIANKPKRKALATLFGKLEDNEIREYSGHQHGLIYSASIYGDTPHAAPPLIVQRNQTAERFKLEGDLPQQIYLLVNQKWLVVRAEWDTPGDVYIYDLSSHKAQFVLRNVNNAMFAPL